MRGRVSKEKITEQLDRQREVQMAMELRGRSLRKWYHQILGLESLPPAMTQKLEQERTSFCHDIS